ncbi:hypothetical protein CPB85DRAFT_1457288 [Mucidula mucida]|nr:hypothetical protein CPB85DRAFT_1457288 [Mucidula mucida]
MVSLGALVHNFMNKEPSSPSPKKRNGTIFPADFNVFSTASCNEKDAASTWEFQAPSLPASRQTCDVPVASPAQEIAARYRKKLTIIVPHREASSSRISNNSFTSSEGATLVGSDKYLEFITLSEDKGPQLRHDPACEQILADARKETISEMTKCGALQRKSLVCPRIGCRDTLRNARGLKMHLALHDISNKVNGLSENAPLPRPPMDLAPPPESPAVGSILFGDVLIGKMEWVRSSARVRKPNQPSFNDFLVNNVDSDIVAFEHTEVSGRRGIRRRHLTSAFVRCTVVVSDGHGVYVVVVETKVVKKRIIDRGEQTSVV